MPSASTVRLPADTIVIDVDTHKQVKHYKARAYSLSVDIIPDGLTERH